MDTAERYREIIKYNIISIVMNLFLSIAKIAIGVVTHAHAVILDGIEGFSDLISSVFTIFSAKIGEKKADKTHPFGYGRIEYLVSLFVTIIIILFGIRSIIESVRNIMSPHDAPDYDIAVVVIMVLSMVLKISYGYFLRRKGREINSSAMIISGTDCMGDALTAAAILAAILIKNIFDVDIEHYLCIGISLMIIYTGIQMFRECVTKILGTTADPEFKSRIRKMIVMEDGVFNVSNMVIHNYGEGVNVGSVDIEVDENMRAAEISRLSHRITEKAAKEGLTLTAVGISGTNTSSPEADRIWDTILGVVMQHNDILKANGFAIDFSENQISFNIIQDPDASNKEETRQSLIKELQSIFPDMKIEIRATREV